MCVAMFHSVYVCVDPCTHPEDDLPVEIAACLGEVQDLFLNDTLPSTVSLKKCKVNSSLSVSQNHDPLFLILLS